LFIINLLNYFKMVKMEFKKTDLKSRLLSGSYKKEDDQASACSTNTS
jgi:hypothetical protein